MPALLTDGVSRDENGAVHHWQSDGLPAEVQLEWEQPVSLSRLEIKCDTNLKCNIMMRKTSPKSHHTREVPPGVAEIAHRRGASERPVGRSRLDRQ